MTVGVRIILEKDRKVLLVKHTYHPQWFIPGGGVKKGETLEGAVRRELAEELGADLGELRLFGVYTNFYEFKSDHIVVFECHEFSMTGETDSEIERFEFFDLDNIPDKTSPGTGRRLKEYLNRSGPPQVDKW